MAQGRSRPVVRDRGGATKTCGLCGTTQSDTAQTCYRCGASLAKARSAAAPKRSQDGAAPAASGGRGRKGGRRGAGTPAGRRGLGGQKLLLLILVVVLAAAVAVVLKLQFGGDSSVESQASSSASDSSITAPIDSAKNASVEANMRAINAGVQSYIAENGAAPDAAQVSATGAVGQLVGQWPTNPYTKQPVKSGTTSGDFTYEATAGSADYKLIGYGADGPVCTLP